MGPCIVCLVLCFVRIDADLCTYLFSPFRRVFTDVCPSFYRVFSSEGDFCL